MSCRLIAPKDKTLMNGLITSQKFAPVMNYPAKMKVFDLSAGYDPDYIKAFNWGIGKYDEKRQNMYTASQYKGQRNIHMGIDIWTAEGSPVFAFDDGEIAYFTNNNQPGNYGPTIVTKHILNSKPIFALHGHLSVESLNDLRAGQPVIKGEKIATLGTEEVNGGWAPHLHFQLSIEDPGKADMPGVVSDKDHKKALTLYPDPRIVLGEIT